MLQSARRADDPTVDPAVVAGSRDPKMVRHAVDNGDAGAADPDPEPVVDKDPPDPVKAATDPDKDPDHQATATSGADQTAAGGVGQGGTGQGGVSTGQGGNAQVTVHTHNASDLQKLHEATRDLRAASDSQVEKLDRINTAMDKLEERINKRIDEQKAAIKRASMPTTQGSATDDGKKEVRRAFCNLLMHVAQQRDVTKANEEYHSALKQNGYDRQADLLIGDNPSGGYVAPPEFRTELIKLVQEKSPMMDLVNTETISAPEFVRPRENAMPTAVWAGERDTRTPDTVVPFASQSIVLHELDSIVDVSWRSLRVASLDIDGWLLTAFSTQFARSMGYKIIDGTGVGQPVGVLNSEHMTTVEAGSTTGGLSADGLIDAAHHMVEDYSDQAVWVFKRSTIGAIRKFKTSGDGNYIWMPSFTEGNPTTIVDIPYRASDAFQALGNTKRTVGALASWSELYTLVLNEEIEYLVDPYSRRNQGDIRFSARQMAGGGLMQPAAGILISTG